MQELLAYTLELLKFLGGGLRSAAPVIGILLVLRLMVLRQPLEHWKEITVRRPGD